MRVQPRDLHAIYIRGARYPEALVQRQWASCSCLAGLTQHGEQRKSDEQRGERSPCQ